MTQIIKSHLLLVLVFWFTHSAAVNEAPVVNF